MIMPAMPVESSLVKIFENEQKPKPSIFIAEKIGNDIKEKIVRNMTKKKTVFE